MDNKPVVLLIHGAIIPSFSVEYLGHHLRKMGFETRRVSYPSIRGGTEAGIQKAYEELLLLPSYRPIYILAHSLGGPIMYEALRKFLRVRPHRYLIRLVCIGSPFNKSAIGSKAHKLFWPLHLLVRKTIGILESGVLYDREIGVEIGMIAGVKGRGGWNSILRVFPKGTLHDGCISLDETHFDGVTDRIELSLGHEAMLFRKDVARLASTFFDKGTFNP